MTRMEIDDLGLNVEVAGRGPPVVLLHGFTGSTATWAELVETLRAEFTTIAVDIVGHGQSDAPETTERYEDDRCAEDLSRLLRSMGHERACWLGYSMGGRVALQIAVHHRDVVSSLVLEGASPGLRSESERAERRRSDEALADRIEADGVPAFVDEWERLPLFASQAQLTSEARERVRAERLANRAHGLANSLRGGGTGAQPPLHDRLSYVQAPTLLLAGELDTKFAGIAEEMARSLPDATMHLIEGAGHAAHLERPEAFGAEVLDFLRRVHAGASATDAE